MTFRDVVGEYVRTLAGKPSQEEVKRALYNDLLPAWGLRHSVSIALHESVLLPGRIAHDTSVPADRRYACLKRAYAASIQRGLLRANPQACLQKPAPDGGIRNNADNVRALIRLRPFLYNPTMKEYPVLWMICS